MQDLLTYAEASNQLIWSSGRSRIARTLSARAARMASCDLIVPN